MDPPNPRLLAAMEMGQDAFAVKEQSDQVIRLLTISKSILLYE